MPATPIAMWSAMSCCAVKRSLGERPASDSGWRCSNGEASPSGRACAHSRQRRRGHRRCRLAGRRSSFQRPRRSSFRRSRAWRSHAWRGDR
jgi:hypothetical protein